MYLTQGTHSGGTDGPRWESLLERFLARTLKGKRTGIADEGPVITQGRGSAGAGDFRTAADYPLPSTRSTRLWLRDSGRLTTGEDRTGTVAFVLREAAPRPRRPRCSTASATSRRRWRGPRGLSDQRCSGRR